MYELGGKSEIIRAATFVASSFRAFFGIFSMFARKMRYNARQKDYNIF